MKPLNYNEPEEDCTEFAQTFSLDDGSSDVQVYGLISKLKMMIFTLPDVVKSIMENWSLTEKLIVILISSLVIASNLTFL
jgi:hypothetical protein